MNDRSQAAATDARFLRWLETLERRYLTDLEFAEVTRALRALSSAYVERRARITERRTFDGAGKRAAYAMYYSPLHFITVRLIVEALGAAPTAGRLLDLGCGTGAAGAAWATRLSPPLKVNAVDSHPWAVSEAMLTYQAFGIETAVRRGDITRITLPRSVDAIVAGWVLNELDDRGRRALQTRLLDAAARATSLLIVEPIATRVSPWWDDWAAPFVGAGARLDEWRFGVELPDLLKRLDLAAGMHHDELTARSLYLESTPLTNRPQSSPY